MVGFWKCHISWLLLCGEERCCLICLFHLGVAHDGLVLLLFSVHILWVNGFQVCIPSPLVWVKKQQGLRVFTYSLTRGGKNLVLRGRSIRPDLSSHTFSSPGRCAATPQIRHAVALHPPLPCFLQQQAGSIRDTAFASRSGTGEHVTICSKLVSLRPSFESVYPPFLRFLFMLDIARRISFIHLIFPNPSRCSFPVLLLRLAAETHPRQVRGTPSTSPYQRVPHATW